MIRIKKMKNKIASIIAFICLGMISTASAYEIVCPSEIEVKYNQPEIKDMPDGWEMSYKKNLIHFLDNMDVYYDKPIYLGILKPEPGIINGNRYESTWTLGSIYDKKDSYVSCSYSGIYLIKKIDPSMESCWSIESKNEFGYPQFKLVCSTEELEMIE